jgi:hypothetical protein
VASECIHADGDGTGRRGRRVGGELSCGGLEGSEGGDEGVELGSGGLGEAARAAAAVCETMRRKGLRKALK